MRIALALILTVLVAAPIVAGDLGTARPPKPAVQHTPPPPDPDVLRQGGDTILDAVEISIGYETTGTTTGYTDDYDEVCPYDMSTSPDVVYTLVPGYDIAVDVDLWGSNYDTKVYIYDEDLALVACNDDFYDDYTSRLEMIPLDGGVRYYVVVDGYGGDHGDYVFALYEPYWHGIYCPPGGQEEEEPFMEDGYVDAHNGGCDAYDALGHAPMQHITSEYFCGYAGWYHDDAGLWQRDTDWLTVTIPASGSLTLYADSELPARIQEMAPQDCGQVAAVQTVPFGPFVPTAITVSGAPGSLAWLRVMTTVPDPPPGWGGNTVIYLLEVPEVVPVVDHSWSSVKALFD